MNDQKEGNQLKKSLDLKDLVLLNTATIVGLTTLPQVAQFGMASAFMYVLAILIFFIPCGLMVAELSARIPGEGGFYLWTKTAFGRTHGFIVAWCYWLSNVVWLPTVLLLIVTSVLFLFVDLRTGLIENPFYIGISTISILWLIIILNILGLDKAKWIQNIGGIAIWLCILLITALGIYALLNEGTLVLEQANWIPDFSDLGVLPFFAAVAFAFGGLELTPVMAEEIKNPQRNIPKAIFLTSVTIGMIYVVGTISVIVLLPKGEVNIIDGVAQAFSVIRNKLDLPWVSTIGIILVLLSTLGLFGSWLTGTTRLPFVIGLDNVLPEKLAKVHPKYGSPYVSLITQGVILTLFLSASFLGSTLQDAFLILYDMAVILYFIPFMYMFGALIIHVKKGTNAEVGLPLFKGNILKTWLIGGCGFMVMLLGVILACIPSEAIENTQLFLIKVIGGSIVLIGGGMVIFYLRSRNKIGG